MRRLISTAKIARQRRVQRVEQVAVLALEPGVGLEPENEGVREDHGDDHGRERGGVDESSERRHRRGIWMSSRWTRVPTGSLLALRLGAGHLRRPLFGALLHLLWRNVLDMRGDRPRVAEGILDEAEAVAPEHVVRLHQRRRAGVDRLLVGGVGVLDVGHDVDACSAELLRSLRARLRERVGKHEKGVTDLELRVHDRSAWAGHAGALLGAESALIEVDRGRRVFDGQIRHEGAVTLRDRLRHAYLLWLGSIRRLPRDSRHALESNPPNVLDSVSLIPQPRKRPSHQTRPRILLLVTAVAAAAVGWLLNYLFVADQSRAGLLALPVWLIAGAALGWLAIRWRERSRDQRLAESRLDRIGAASTDAIRRVGADGIVSDWSAGAEALYGYEADEIIGRPVADLLGDEESDRVAEAI